MVRPRSGYRDIVRYSGTPVRCAIDLSDNTNLWGTAPVALHAMRQASTEDLSRYPSVSAAGLRDALGRYVNLPAEMIVTGCGSDDVLDSAIRAFAEPGDTLCLPDPTFSMIPVFSRANGVRPIAVPLTRKMEIDADAMIALGARVTYLCSPNNPTGTRSSREVVEKVVAAANGLVVIDEAYAEFDSATFLDLVSTGRVLVTRTMSKAFGLAGLRVGYGVASPDIVAEIEKARGPYRIGTLAESAAIAALTHDVAWMREQVAAMVQNRTRFIGELRARGFAPLDSFANFVLVPVTSCSEVSNTLAAGGVAARAFQSLAGIGDAIRITIGPWPMMERCLELLGSVK